MTSAEYGAASLESHQPIQTFQEYRVVLFTCFLCLVVVAEGYDIGVLNGAAVRMQDELGLSTWQISGVVTTTPLLVMFGTLFGGALADSFGRRGALGVCCSLLTGGPCFMSMASSALTLMAARAIVGVGIGMGYVVVSMYIAEVAPAEMRGRLTTLEEVFLNIGMLLGYLANFSLYGIPNDWRWMLALGAVLPLLVLSFILCPGMPESPRWLFLRGRTEEAEKVLSFFVGKTECKRDLLAMEEQKKSGEGEKFITWQELFSSLKDHQTRQMILAGVTVGCGQTACGYLAIAYYSSAVLKTTMSERAAFMATVVMGVVKLLVVLVALLVLERAGRRPMLFVSTVISGLACVWLAVVFTIDASNFSRALGFALYMAGFSLGLGPICFVYVSEVFPTLLRAKGMALVLFLSRIIGAASTFLFPVTIQAIGVSASFWILSAVNAILAVCIGAFVVETQGRTLEDVGKLFSA